MISIIIVNYKVLELLERCVRSIIENGDQIDRQIIIIDNDSKDASQIRIKAIFPQVEWIQNSKNLGFATAVNQGIKIAKYRFILLLNPDSVILPGSLSAFIEFFDHNPSAGIVGGKVLSPDRSFQPQSCRRIPDISSAFWRLFGFKRLFPNHRLSQQYELTEQEPKQVMEVEAVSGAFLCTTRSLIDKIGLLDQTYFLYGEDLDFCYRAIKAGYKNFCIPDACVIHDRGASRKRAQFRTLFHTHAAMYHFYRKHSAFQHCIFVNYLIYLTIWLRWLFFEAKELIMFSSRGIRIV